jgi:hypothetical protein
VAKAISYATLCYNNKTKVGYKVLVSSGTLDNCRLLLFGLRLLLLSCPTECGAKSLGSDAQPTRLLDDGLVYWQRRTVNLDNILRQDH